MEGKKIKSALEIAMEKAAGIPELTHEQIIKQKKREYEPRGVAIATKYLEGAFREGDLHTELRKYQGQEGEIVRNAFLTTLCQSIKLDDMRKSLRALDGIGTLEVGVNLDKIKGEVEAVFNEFHQQTERRGAIYEDPEREKLRGLWIYGSAVKPNLEESEDWRQELGRIQSKYDSRLNKLREKVLHLLESGSAGHQIF